MITLSLGNSVNRGFFKDIICKFAQGQLCHHTYASKVSSPRTHDCSKQTLLKAQRTKGLSVHIKVISQVLSQIVVNFQLQNLDQAPTSKSQPSINIKELAKITTEPQLHNLDRT